MSRELKPWDDRDPPPVFPRQMTAHQSERQIKVQPPPQSRSEVVLSKQAPGRNETARRSVSFAVPFWATRVESGMALKKKAPVTVALQNGRSPYSLHQDLASHFRMARAVVGIRSCLGKRVRELFIRIHDLGPEHAVCAHRRMRNVITVDPGNCRSDGYRDRLRPKNEIIDFHRRVCRGGPVSIRRDTR